MIPRYEDTYDGMVESPNGEWVRLCDIFTPELIALINGGR